MMYSYIRFDTQYAVWICCRPNVAPKSNLIQLGSAHEWSGVWTGPYTNTDNDDKDRQTWTCNSERRFRYCRVVESDFKLPISG